MSELDQSIMERHFDANVFTRPVPRELVDEALALAQHAPSNSKIQPWRSIRQRDRSQSSLRTPFSEWLTTRPRTSPRCPRRSSAIDKLASANLKVSRRNPLTSARLLRL